MKFKSSNFLAFSITTLLFITLIASPIFAASTSSTKASRNFIKSSCSGTTYSSLCYKTLSPYSSVVKTSELKLCYTSIMVTIKSARNTATMVSRLSKQKGLTKSELAVLKDCKENIQDSIYEFDLARKAISSLSGTDREFQMSNAKTWASAAITDEDTCLDGFSEKEVNPAVKSKIQSAIKTVSRLSSISLSLINHLSY